MKVLDKNEICNLALQKLGIGTISSLSEGSPEAEACDRLYQYHKSVLFSLYNWSFTTAMDPLTKEDDPFIHYTYKYSKPDKCLRIIRGFQSDGTPVINMAPEKPAYQIIGKYIASDVNNLHVLYVKDTDNVQRFDPVFTKALVHFIAADLAKMFTDSANLAIQLEALANDFYDKAKMNDAQQNQPSIQVVSPMYLESGFNG